MMVDSPPWSRNTKLVVALTLVALVGGVLIYFRHLLAPLLLAFLLAYLFHPLVFFLHQRLRLSWRWAVSLIYLLILILFLGFLTWGGISLVAQLQNLIALVQRGLENFPAFLNTLSGRSFSFGPFTFDLSRFDLSGVTQQALGAVQGLLGRLTSLLGAAASEAFAFLGWTFFVLLISYFVLAESGGVRDTLVRIEVPRYQADMERLSRELERIWNAFLRGQLILFGLTVLVYTLLLSVLGVRYSLGLALLAGLAKFIPYIGPAANWIVLALVAYFQDFKLAGLSPFHYTLLVLVLALVTDQIFDNLVSPRIIGQALRVHPAAILVGALVAANLIGLIGVLIAAPLVATLKLFGRYAIRKLFDLPPWPEEEPPPPSPLFSPTLLRRIFHPFRKGEKP